MHKVGSASGDSVRVQATDTFVFSYNEILNFFLPPAES